MIYTYFVYIYLCVCQGSCQRGSGSSVYLHLCYCSLLLYDIGALHITTEFAFDGSGSLNTISLLRPELLNRSSYVWGERAASAAMGEDGAAV